MASVRPLTVLTVVVVALLVTVKLCLKAPPLGDIAFVTDHPLDIVTSIGIFSFAFVCRR